MDRLRSRLLRGHSLVFLGSLWDAAIPNVVGKDRLQLANSAFQTGANVAALIGPVLAGFVLIQTGLTGIVIADSVSYLVSGTLVMRLRSDLEAGRVIKERPNGRSLARSVWIEWMEGVNLVLKERWLAGVFLVMVVGWFGSSFAVVAVVPFVRHSLGGSAQVYGWTVACQGLGGIAGGLALARFPARSPALRVVACSAVAGSIIIAMAVLKSIPATLVGSFLMAVAFLPVSVGISTLIQGHVPNEFRGRVFGTYLMVGALVAVIGSLISGVVTSIFGPPAIIAFAGSLIILSAALGLAVMVPATKGLWKCLRGRRPAPETQKSSYRRSNLPH